MDDPVQKDKLIANIKASPKMLSMQLTAFFGILSAGLATALASIPLDQQISIVTSILSHYGWGLVLVPVVGAALRWYARVHPQTNLAPQVPSQAPPEVLEVGPLSPVPVTTPTTPGE